MRSALNHHNQEKRQRLAMEAARLMSETGMRDFGQAKRKAAMRLGIRDDSLLPRNSEIEQALREYQRLFQSATQPRLLRSRREAAAEAMKFFARFEPRLVGAVLEGTADRHSAVCLHLYTDDATEVPLFLAEHGIMHEQHSRTVRLDRERSAEFPVFLFAADDVPFELTVLPRDILRQAPLDRVTEKPMRCAPASVVQHLLADDVRSCSPALPTAARKHAR